MPPTEPRSAAPRLRAAARPRRPPLWRWPAALACLALLVLLAPPSHAAEQRRVLILYSLGSDAASVWQSLLRRGLEAELADKPLAFPAGVFEERFDAVRLGEERAAAAMEQYLTIKYGDLKFDTVITENYVAARFLSARPRLFPGARRIYLNHGRRGWQPSDGVGYEVRADFQHAIGVIPRFIPSVRRVVVIGDGTEQVQDRLSEARSVAAGYQGQLVFEFWDRLSFEQLYRQARALDEDSAIFLMGSYHDVNGAVARPVDIAHALAATTRAPIFANLESLVVPGVVGGYVVSGERIGRAIGRILQQQAPDIAGIPGYVFDYPTARRFHLQDPPANAQWRNRPTSIWDLYLWQIVGSLTLIGLEALLITALVLALRGRRQSMAALDDEHKQLEARVSQRTLELLEANTKLEQLATTDPLTGIGNRRRMTDQINAELERCRRFQHPLSLLMFDIDHFKLVNDTYGHDAGDRAIVAVAKALADGIRSIDMASRFGGEEFVVLMPETEIAVAALAAERLRMEIAALAIIGDKGEQITLTISVGVGAAAPDGVQDSVSSLLIRADRALYEAKNTGRNRVVCAAP